MKTGKASARQIKNNHNHPQDPAARTVVYLILVACLALMAVGAWRGDFSETRRNGTTL